MNYNLENKKLKQNKSYKPFWQNMKQYLKFDKEKLGGLDIHVNLCKMWGLTFTFQL